jgi:hypothetical protein
MPDGGLSAAVVAKVGPLEPHPCRHCAATSPESRALRPSGASSSPGEAGWHAAFRFEFQVVWRQPVTTGFRWVFAFWEVTAITARLLPARCAVLQNILGREIDTRTYAPKKSYFPPAWS